MKKNNKIKIILFAVALIANLLMFFYLYFSRGQQFFNPLVQGTDQAEYGRIAINLAERHSFSLSQSAPYITDSARTPLFPFFLTVSYLLTGGFILATLLNILISALTAIIVFEIAMTITHRLNIAVFSGIIFACLPYKAYLSSMAMADILFTFFFSLFVLLFLKIISKEINFNFKNVVLVGAFLGLSVLTRPVTQFFIIIPIFVLLLFFKEEIKKRFMMSVLMIAAFVFVLSPWLIRNEIHFGELFLSSVGRYHMYVSYFGPWQAYKDGVSRDEKNSEILKYIEEKYGKDAMYNITASTELARLAKEKILAHPLSYAFFHISATPVYFLNNGMLLTLREAFDLKLPNINIAQKVFALDFNGLWESVLESGILFIIFFFVSYFLTALKSGLGILWALGYLRRNFIVGIFAILTMAYFSLIVGFEGHARFRIPIEPLLIVFFTLAIAEIWNFIMGLGNLSNQVKID